MNNRPLPNCYAGTWSYGEICVGCNCCGRIDNSHEAIKKARKKYFRHELERIDRLEKQGVWPVQAETIKAERKWIREEMKKLRPKETQ